jgi:hypothetical protein
VLSFIPFPFAFDCCLHCDVLLKNTIMQKQLRIITRRRMAVCPLSTAYFPPVPAVPAVAFSRHFQRRPVYFRPLPSIKVYLLASTWFIWCYPSGRRQLAALPF